MIWLRHELMINHHDLSQMRHDLNCQNPYAPQCKSCGVTTIHAFTQIMPLGNSLRTIIRSLNSNLSHYNLMAKNMQR